MKKDAEWKHAKIHAAYFFFFFLKIKIRRRRMKSGNNCDCPYVKKYFNGNINYTK